MEKQMSHFFRLKSHKKEDKDNLLYCHLKNVGELSKKIVMNKKIKNQELFSEIAYLIGISHDFGKATTYFQNYLKNGEVTEKAHHGKLSSIFGYFLVKKYLESKNFSDDIAWIAWLVIMKHHGDIINLMGLDGELAKLREVEIEKEQINDIKRNHLDEVKAIYASLSPFDISIDEFFNEFENICREIEDKGEKAAMAGNLKNYYLILFFYSVLLDADKSDAAGLGEIILARKDIPPDLVDRYKKIKFGITTKYIDVLRDKAYREVISNITDIDPEKDKIFSLELPTGFGKTLTALSFALKLRDVIKNNKNLNFAPRIIYSLPFLSIIEQNAEVFSEALAPEVGIPWEKLFKMEKREAIKELEGGIPSDLLLKHHHLIDVKYKTQDEELERDVWKSSLLIEGWYSEIVITTFVQLFHSLITNRNKAARKFHNIVNSIIILDEVQSIPYEYWLLVKESLKHIAHEYNCWIILMTATQPIIFEDKEIRPLIKNKKEYFKNKNINRLEYEIDINEKNFDDFKKDVIKVVLDEKEKDIMIVLNTIESSKELYNFLRNEFKKIYGEPNISDEGIAEFGGTLLINLSTHILPSHRLKRIQKSKTEENRRKIIVTTQLIEAGVDISVDIIYRDLAPFDCIIQTGGRCNRHNEKKEKGICKIVNLVKENKKFSYIYDSILIGATRDVLEELLSKNGKLIGEEDFVDAIGIYFQKILERGSQVESRNRIDAMRLLNFSDVSKFELIKEEYPKIDVFVDIDDNAKRIWRGYQNLKQIKDPLQRRKEFLKIKKEFCNYLISVSEKKAENFLVEPYLGYITKEKYDIETGYI